jgi:hypothetical protein
MMMISIACVRAADARHPLPCALHSALCIACYIPGTPVLYTRVLAHCPPMLPTSHLLLTIE